MSAEDAIRRTLAQYCQFLDDALFDQWAELFTIDATFNPLTGVIQGREHILGWAQANPNLSDPARRGRHLTLNALIDVEGDKAAVRADFLFLLPSPQGPILGLVGRYDDVLARDGSRWRFVSRKATAVPGWGPPPDRAR